MSISMYAERKYHINVLNEISAQQAKNHPRPWSVSKYTHTDAQGRTVTKYFDFAPSIKHNSSLVIIKAKNSPYPWQVRINGSFYYADFDSDYELRVGDEGVLKYNGDRLYFVIDD